MRMFFGNFTHDTMIKVINGCYSQIVVSFMCLLLILCWYQHRLLFFLFSQIFFEELEIKIYIFESESKVVEYIDLIFINYNIFKRPFSSKKKTKIKSYVHSNCILLILVASCCLYFFQLQNFLI